MRKAIFSAALILAGFASAPSHAVVPTQDEPVAILRALDKVTARVEELEIPEGQPFKFGTLTITVRACRVTPPEDTPEAAAFLDVTELKPGEQDAPVFHGWMFASSPALSAMEHPVYDLWVIGCKTPPAASPAASNLPASVAPDQPPAQTTAKTKSLPVQSPAAR